jgi:RNA recognition motif-containing protein
MFRGMAFVKYKDNEQAMKVFEKMNNLDISGRKLRIEYKRKVQEAETVPEENTNKLVDQLNTFKGNTLLNELAFPCASSFQRKQIHQFAEKLGLVHFSTGEGESKYVLVKKKEYLDSNLNTPPATPPNLNNILLSTSASTSTTGVTSTSITSNNPINTPNISNISGTSPSISINMSSSPASKGQPIKGRRPSNSQEYRQKGFDTGKSPEDRHLYGSPNDSKISRSFGASSPFAIKSPPSSYGQSPTYRNSALILNR